jgi:hypothetical protein
MLDRRRHGRLVTMFCTLLLVTAVAMPGGSSATASTFDEPVAPVTINEFLPEDRDLSDCISVLPKPGCGSEARGGWGQTAILGALLVGLGIIGTRVVMSIRRRDGALAASVQAAEAARTSSDRQPPEQQPG